MTRLEDLIYSLATVLICYHDSQGVNQLVKESEEPIRLKKSREKAIEIIQAKDPIFDKHLEALIKECTAGYPLRQPFLYYILHQITFLKSVHSREKSFTLHQLAEYKNEMSRMITDFKTLLTTPKSKTCSVKYCALTPEGVKEATNKTVSLSGLLNDAYYGTQFCNSGTLLMDEVLARFYITDTSSEAAIKDLTDNMCIEHQNALLIPELVLAKSNLEKLTASQKATIEEELQPKLDAANIKIKEQKENLEAMVVKLKITEPKPVESSSDMELLNKKLKEAQEQIAALEDTVKKQRETIANPVRQFAFGPYGPFFLGALQNKWQQDKSNTSQPSSRTTIPIPFSSSGQ